MLKIFRIVEGSNLFEESYEALPGHVFTRSYPVYLKNILEANRSKEMNFVMWNVDFWM